MDSFTEFNNSPVDMPEEIKNEKKHMTKVFSAFSAAYLISLVLVLSADAFLYAFKLSANALYIIRSIISALHTPLIFVIMYFLCKNTASARHPVTDKMTIKKYAAFFLVCFFLMVAGSFIGNFVSDIIGRITGTNTGHIVSDVLDSMSLFEIFIFAVVLAPIFEELVFRKLLIDKLSRYGTVFCVVVSGLIFGLYHGNFQQFFYAFGVGGVLAYVYCVYGNIIYTIILHVLINATGSLIPVILKIGESAYLTNPQIIYMYFHIFFFLSGALIFAVNLRYARFYMTGGNLTKPFGVLFLNPAFAATIIISVILFISNLI